MQIKEQSVYNEGGANVVVIKVQSSAPASCSESFAIGDFGGLPNMAHVDPAPLGLDKLELKE